jgi:flagellar basal-body rod protein FlgF
MRINAQGQLETGAGHLVMGQGGPINMPPGMLVSINSDGNIYVQDPAQGTNAPAVQVDQIALRDASAVKLSRRSDGLFQVADQAPGSDFTTGPNVPGLIPQALEGSNVSALEAMTRLMDHSRSFETQIRIIKETKELDEQSSSMLKNA